MTLLGLTIGITFLLLIGNYIQGELAVNKTLRSSLTALPKKHFGEMAHVFQFHVQPLADVHFDMQRTGGVIRLSL